MHYSQSGGKINNRNNTLMKAGGREKSSQNEESWAVFKI